MPLSFEIQRNSDARTDEQVAEILRDPGFGVHFTDHMVSITWTKGQGWHSATVKPYGPLTLDPSAAVLHYGQEIFEGMKAYRHADGSVHLFRPDMNAARFNRSAARMMLPNLPEELFVEAVRQLVEIDARYVPEAAGEHSLYIRPFMIASEAFLGVRAAEEVTFLVIASPVGPYFTEGVKGVDIWITDEWARAGEGGTGNAKCGGNYAASLISQYEGYEHGCTQVMFIEATGKDRVEELGGMNVFFVHADGRLVTPALTGTILEGVTRSSLVELARERGHDVQERQFSIDEWRDGVASGEITEVFACGTAAVISPVGRLAWNGGELEMPDTHEVTMSLRQELLDIQYGRGEDGHGWLYQLV